MNGSRSRGQATIGFALILGIALIGVVTVVALGATALTDIQTSSGTGAAEQAMTQFDSQTSQVALGDSETQTVSVGQTEGGYEVDPDAGFVQVVHVDYDGNLQDDGNDAPNSAPSGVEDDEILYESTLGTVRYRQGDTTVGYQSGGVWKRTGEGQSTMVSPPEFHYRGSTLTFPVVRVNQGSSSVQSGSGSVDLRVTQAGDPVDEFPDPSKSYPDTTGNMGPYDNPSENGTVVVYMESEYYQAWANYFRDRTDGTVETSDDPGPLINANPDPNGDGNNDQVVAVKLVSTGQTGAFTMPGDGSALGVSGISDHSMSDFEITLAPDNTDNARFNNLQWSMYVDDGGKEFEAHLRKDGGGGQCDDQEFSLVVFYSPDGTDDYHGWKKSNIAPTCNDEDGDGDIDTRLHIDFVDDEDADGDPRDPSDPDEDDMNLTYTTLSQSDLTHFSTDGRSLMSTAEFDEHASGPDAVYWESVTYDADTSDTTNPSEEPIDGLINHYFSLLGPGFDLTVDDKSSNTVTESASSGIIEYTGGDEFITFIHLSENDVEVRIG